MCGYAKVMKAGEMIEGSGCSKPKEMAEGEQWTRVQVFCLCHKTHTVAEKTWLLGKHVLKGCVRTCLFFCNQHRIGQTSSGRCRKQSPNFV